MNTIETSILIPTKNGQKTIDRCLTGIFSQKTKYRHEVVVVDSGSTDTTLEIISRYPATVYTIKPDEFGHGKTRNYLASLAKGTYLVFLTQDAVPANEQWLDNLLSGFCNDTVGGVYGRNIPFDGCDPLEERFVYSEFPPFSELRDLRGSLPGDFARHRSKYVHFSNTNSAIRKSVWQSTPFEQDAYFAEDQRWAEAILTKGLCIAYQASAVVYHSHALTLPQRARRAYASATEKVNFMQTMAVCGFEAAQDWAYLIRSGRKWHQKFRWCLYSILHHYTIGTAHWLGGLRVRRK